MMGQHNKASWPEWVAVFLSSIIAGCILGCIVYVLTHDRNLAITTAVICYAIVKVH